jgi:CrcB protein
MTWWEWVLIGIAGGVGAPVRYVVDTLVSQRRDGTFPVGTFVVNITGGFLLGLITGLALYHGFAKAPKLVIGTGFVGAYTTFSTFGYETIALFEQGENRTALANLTGSLLAGAAAAAAGIALGSL